MAEKYLTVEEVAKILKVEANTVRTWIREKKISAIILGGASGYRITERDLQAFILSRKTQTESGN